MGLLSKKTEVNSPKKQKGGLLGALGIQTEAVKTPDDEAAEKREQQIKLAWLWVRGRIDLAVHEYYRTGTFTKLEEYVERPALDALKQHLHALRGDNMLWQQPDRKPATEAKLTVVDVKLNKKKLPVSFTIRERFKDFSTYERVNADKQLELEARCPGTERVIEAEVTVIRGSEYKLHSVRRVADATLS